uniref:Uncharacterized protein n=1 Tax=Arundo donax TaxID=35708 RepID=A0A0A8Y6C2_ARUDO
MPSCDVSSHLASDPHATMFYIPRNAMPLLAQPHSLMLPPSSPSTSTTPLSTSLSLLSSSRCMLVSAATMNEFRCRPHVSMYSSILKDP